MTACIRTAFARSARACSPQTIEFADTSYHSVRDDVQLNMFKSMGKLYDGFGPGSTVQMTVVNTLILREELDSRRFFDPQRQITAQAAEDAETFNAILAEKTRQGVSNIRRRRFMTITCAAETADASVPKLSRLEASSSRLLGGVGSKCRTLDGKDRLTVLHGLLNPGKPFDMDYKRDLGLRMPQTTKDLIAPTTIDFKPEGRCDCFRLDDMWGQVLVFRRFGSELTDRALADIVDLLIPMAVSWFAQPIEQAKAKAFVQQRSAWIDKEVIEEQRTAVSKGYDFSILPYELRYSKEETEGVLNELTGKGQHLYQFTGLVYTYAPSRHQLDNQVLRIISSARGNPSNSTCWTTASPRPSTPCCRWVTTTSTCPATRRPPRSPCSCPSPRRNSRTRAATTAARTSTAAT